MESKLQSTLHRLPPVDKLDGKLLREKISSLQASLAEARAQGVQESQPAQELTTVLTTMRDRLGQLKKDQWVEIERLCTWVKDMEIRTAELQEGIGILEGYGTDLTQTGVPEKLARAKRVQTERREALSASREKLTRLLAEPNPALVNIPNLRNELGDARTLSMDGSAQSELMQLWTGLQKLIDRGKAKLEEARQARVDVTAIARAIEEAMGGDGCLCPQSASGCRVSVALLQEVIQHAEGHAFGLLTYEVASAKAKLDEERKRGATFLKALDRLERAQQNVRCEVHLTLSLSDFLQAEINKESLESKLDDVTRRLNATLGDTHKLSHLLTQALGPPSPPTSEQNSALTSADSRRQGELVHVKKDLGRRLLPRCQNLPEEAFASPEEAASRYDSSSSQPRLVHVLSYGWRTPGQPDPDGTTLGHMVQFLQSPVAQRQEHAEDRLLFLE